MVELMDHESQSHGALTPYPVTLGCLGLLSQHGRGRFIIKSIFRKESPALQNEPKESSCDTEISITFLVVSDLVVFDHMFHAFVGTTA